MTYVVKLNKASSPSGVAYVGPGYADGFKVEDRAQACVMDEYQAQRLADHFRGSWRGFYGFSPDQITVEAA